MSSGRPDSGVGSKATFGYRVFLWLNAAVFAAFGLWYLLAPRAPAAAVGLVAPVPSALTDLRASCGGFQLGVAAAIAWSTRTEESIGFGLVTALFAIGGFALGRVLGIVVDGSAPISQQLVLLELFGTGANTIALNRWQRRA